MSDSVNSSLFYMQLSKESSENCKELIGKRRSTSELQRVASMSFETYLRVFRWKVCNANMNEINSVLFIALISFHLECFTQSFIVSCRKVLDKLQHTWCWCGAITHVTFMAHPRFHSLKMFIQFRSLLLPYCSFTDNLLKLGARHNGKVFG